VPRPLIGISAAVEPASFGPWVEERSVLLPIGYARAVQAAGGIAAMLPPDGQAAEAPDELLDRLDALILGGGADVDPARYGAEREPQTGRSNPDRDRFEIALARRAEERDLPLLGVCRGMQILNVAAGGSLEQHLPDRLGHEQHRPVPGSWSEHEVRLEPGSLAAGAAGAEQLSVKTHHHHGRRHGRGDRAARPRLHPRGSLAPRGGSWGPGDLEPGPARRPGASNLGLLRLAEHRPEQVQVLDQVA
jgi:putative glutamine amidotransferase